MNFKFSLFFLLGFAGLFLFSSCSKDEYGSVRVKITAVYDNEPLVMFDDHPFPGDMIIEFSHVSYFMSDIALVNQDGDAEMIKEIELIDLSFTNESTALEGYQFIINDIPAGDYQTFRFGLGVPADLNAQTPDVFTSDHPLSNTGYYWNGWESYIFSKTEGNLDTLGVGNLDLGYAFHAGSDVLYRLLEAPKQISITEDQTTEIHLMLDYRKAFVGDNGTIDIPASPRNHTPDKIDHMTQITDNIVAALTIIQ